MQKIKQFFFLLLVLAICNAVQAQAAAARLVVSSYGKDTLVGNIFIV